MLVARKLIGVCCCSCRRDLILDTIHFCGTKTRNTEPKGTFFSTQATTIYVSALVRSVFFDEVATSFYTTIICIYISDVFDYEQAGKISKLIIYMSYATMYLLPSPCQSIHGSSQTSYEGS